MKPGTWYSLQLTAHNGAGSRVVTTQFATLSLTGDDGHHDDGDNDDDNGDDDEDDGDDDEKRCFPGQTLLPRIGSTPGTRLDQVDNHSVSLSQLSSY